ncbi:energy transducer TonB [Caulobacter hibisci]|uniref:Energy transducer TonB n=1 Tax=Caulobacter hibisci TaxID=2035993 RepID=A0ABS0T3T5_9CAUL|nr:energy transducer TonB [Caulobacter hibisci]MBI1686532.1 energy transducer TonB [Caulobacter hibisci]
MKRKAWFAGLTALAFASGSATIGLADPLPQDSQIIVSGTVARYYPDRAQRMEVNGWARVRCIAQPPSQVTGRVSDCVVVGEFPAAFGFGKAAQLITERLGRLVTPPAAGEPVYIHIRFNVTDGGRSWSSPVKPPSGKVLDAARPAGADALGTASLSCEAPLEASGPLTACKVLSEGAPGQGYGAAAIAVAQSAYKTALRPPPKALSVRLYGAGVETLGDVENGDWLELAAVEGGPSVRPSQSARLVCGWTPDGRLSQCQLAPPLKPIPGLTPPEPSPQAASEALAFSQGLRLVRKVVFAINWGQ